MKKSQKGFIGLPILITVLLGILVISGGTYFIIHKDSSSQTDSQNASLTNNGGKQWPVNKINKIDSEWNKYENSLFSFEYPKDWQLEVFPNGESFELRTPGPDFGQSSILISIISSLKQSRSLLDNFPSLSFEEIVGQRDGYKLKCSERKSPSDVISTTCRMGYTSNQLNFLVVNDSYEIMGDYIFFIPTGKNIIMVSFQSMSATRADKDAATINEILWKLNLK